MQAEKSSKILKGVISIVVFTLIVVLVSMIVLWLNPDSVNRDLFSKKIECARLRDGLETHIENDWNYSGQNANLGVLFYSPLRNSCMYTMEVTIILEDGIRQYHNLYDALTNEKVESFTGCTSVELCDSPIEEGAVDFRSLLKKYY